MQDRLIAAINDFFAKVGLEKVNVPILQPAEPFLDSVGEDLRRRIFMTENEYGKAMCLRPEFTIPVCLAHIGAAQILPHRYAYLGEVFRQRRTGENSFYQAGIEDLGDTDECRADAASLADALALLQHLLPEHFSKTRSRFLGTTGSGIESSFEIFTGDHRVFDAVLSALGLAESWQRRLSRCFGDRPRLRVVLNDLSSPAPPLSLPLRIAQLLETGDEHRLVELIEGQMHSFGLSVSFSRTPVEIARRLREKAALSRMRIAPDRLQLLDEFLSIHVPLSQASVTLASFARQAGLDLDRTLAQFDARCQMLKARGLALENLYYDGAFGRPLDYYTGFVYEIRYRDQILAGGGRYDHLLHLLGASMRVPAVGFSLWLDRMIPLLARKTG